MADPRLQFVRLHVAWMVATILVLEVAGRFSLVGFYVISVIGFFLVEELTATEGIRPAWRRRVRLVSALLVLGFVAVVGWQIQQIVTSA